MRSGKKEDMSLCIKNTFIDDADAAPVGVRERSSSEPPRLRLMVIKEESTAEGMCVTEDCGEEMSWTPVVNVEHFICESLQMAPPPREIDLQFSIGGAPGLDREYCNTPSSPRSLSPGIHLESFHDQNPEVEHIRSRRAGPEADHPSPNVEPMLSACDPDDTFELQDTHDPSTQETAKSSILDALVCPPAMQPRGRRRMPELVLGHQANRPQAQGIEADTDAFLSSSSSYRWWTQANAAMICPLSGFPINLLPYPPFKFHMRTEHTKEPPVLVDGPFLVLQVLTTWKFEVLGRPLLVADVSSLDAYMKRCKLGPFRLGRAMQLLAAGTSESHRELAQLRTQARKKLDNLRHVQNFRRTSGDEKQPKKGQAGNKQRGKRGRRTEPQSSASQTASTTK
jgi:hypothetical protein